MRLSKQGLHTVLYKCLRVKDLAREEFSQNDFVGGVVFTLEEAKTIQRMFDDLIGMHSQGAVRIEAEGFETIYMVKHRIEQLEKKHEV